MRLGLGLGLAGPQAAAGSPPPAENLLTWTEEFQNAAWVKTSAVVVADANSSPVATPTADQVTFSASGAVRQVTATAAAAGVGAAASKTLTTAWARYETQAAFDGQDYTFSVYLKAASDGISVRLRFDRSGGFLRCSIEDIGDEAVFLAWGAQLETGAGATDYVPRTT